MNMHKLLFPLGLLAGLVVSYFVGNSLGVVLGMASAMATTILLGLFFSEETNHPDHQELVTNLKQDIDEIKQGRVTPLIPRQVAVLCLMGLSLCLGILMVRMAGAPAPLGYGATMITWFIGAIVIVPKFS